MKIVTYNTTQISSMLYYWLSFSILARQCLSSRVVQKCPRDLEALDYAI